MFAASGGTTLGGISLNKVNERLTFGSSRIHDEFIADNVKRRKVLLEYLMDAKSGTKKVVGQKKHDIEVKYRYKQPNKIGEAGAHVGVVKYYGELNTRNWDTHKTGRSLWTELHVPLSISHGELEEIEGMPGGDADRKKAEFDILKIKHEEGMDILADQMNEILWGVAGGDQGDYPDPVTQVISGSDSTGSITGLSKSSNTWLNSQEHTDSAGASADVGDAASFLLDAMNSGYNKVVDNAPSKSDKPGLWITNREVYEVLQAQLPAYIDYASNKRVDIGVGGDSPVLYMGIPVHFDRDCPKDGSNFRMFLLTPKYWRSVFYKKKNFTRTPFFNMLPKEPADVAQMFVTFSFYCTNTRTNWRAKGITV